MDLPLQQIGRLKILKKALNHKEILEIIMAE
jgi:hypothetical protein